MKEYLKMADVFGVGVSVRDKAPRLIECGGVLAANCLCEQSAEYTAHAINSHDELVAEVERLRLMLSECYPFIKDKSDWGTEYEIDLADRVFDAAK